MSMNRQTLLATRPAAMVLALSLVAAMTAPVLMLPRAFALPAATPTVGCTADGHSVNGGANASAVGCTELSPTPPQDTVSVPPNIVLMLDDSGSMSWDYMPDFGYLKNNSNYQAVIDANNNGVYYNPTVVYLPPPGYANVPASGTVQPPEANYPVQTDMSNVPVDGFGVVTTAKVNLFMYDGGYDTGNIQYSTMSGSTNSYAYPRNYYDNHWNHYLTSWPGKNYDFKTQAGCDNWYNDFDTNRAYNSWYAYNHVYNASKQTCTIYWATTPPPYYFQYSTGPANGPYVMHYVAPATQGCGTQPNCVLDTADSGFKDASGHVITVGQNIANWFAYYHVRISMAKSGLMTAFENLNPAYRFGFGSINANGKSNIPQSPAPFTFNDYTYGGGDTDNQLAVVQPFGNILNGANAIDTTTQRAKFWKWIANETAGGNTPLRKALDAVGQYYMTSQPWQTMSSDPGTPTSPYACRASYAILTTDGFWNGQSPTNVTAGITSKDGPNNQPVPGNDTFYNYAAKPPFSGGTADSGPSLADVATYYWETDLNTSLNNEVATSKQDPAAWQHMTTFTMGLGFTPTGISGTDASGKPVTVPEIFAWARDVDAGVAGAANEVTGFSWPQPSSNSLNNIADLAHAAVNGHGDFFSARSPQDLAAGFSKAISDINARNVPPTPSSVNASVLTAGALTFETGYNTGDWSGSFKVVELNADGSAGASVWPTDPDTLLDTDYHVKGNSKRIVFSYEYNPSASPATAGATTVAYQTNPAAIPSWLDPTELSDLQNIPALTGGNDTVANRINYLLGDKTYEGTTYRSRTSILGAVINASPVYVAGAQSNYNGNWPASSPELPSSAGGVALQTYDEFVGQQSTADAAGYKPGMVYVAANDGMLHAFFASPPKCTVSGGASTCTYAADSGSEAWAFIPRAVYANLGNLTSPSMSYRPTVDESPVSRDVFFGESGGDDYWHTILTGGVGLGGRGVYALDITNPDSNPAHVHKRSDGTSLPTFGAGSVLWEFDSDMAVSSCKAIQSSSTAVTTSDSQTGTCSGSDLGYTISQPNIARLANGTWVVLVPNGYFPDCSTSDIPTADVTSCQAMAAQAPQYNKGTATQTPYSALFVLDAQTGKVLYELKTPQSVPSFGLATPVLGDLTNNNVDNVAYAGDAEGNLWKFNLDASECPNSAPMCVSLVYQAKTPGAQPITTMPRIFPDPVSNGFMVVFGTGKFLGVGDNSNSTVQAVYGIRDPNPAAETSTGKAVSLSNASGAQSVTQSYLQEETVPLTLPDGSANPSPQAGETLRCLTKTSGAACDSTTEAGNNDASQTGGWYFNLDIQVSGAQADAGERVVVSPGAIFASNTVVIESLITGAASSDACSPTTTGAIMAINGATGAPAGVSALGGWPIIGGRINNARTSGNLPIVSALGGGQAFIPGSGLAPSGKTPFSVDAPIWRRRSWSEINQGQ